jgi:hypothetical protein
MRRKAAAGTDAAPVRASSRSSQTWAMLIKRVYELDPLSCPRCGGAMKVIAFIDPRAPERSDGRGDVIEKILRGHQSGAMVGGLWNPSRASPTADGWVHDPDGSSATSARKSHGNGRTWTSTRSRRPSDPHRRLAGPEAVRACRQIHTPVEWLVCPHFAEMAADVFAEAAPDKLPKAGNGGQEGQEAMAACPSCPLALPPFVLVHSVLVSEIKFPITYHFIPDGFLAL